MDIQAFVANLTFEGELVKKCIQKIMQPQEPDKQVYIDAVRDILENMDDTIQQCRELTDSLETMSGTT